MMQAAATMQHREGPVPLKNRLSRLLGDRRITMKQVADGTGLTYRVVLDLYHDRSTRVDLATLAKICDYLRVPVSELLEWTPPAGAGEEGAP